MKSCFVIAALTLCIPSVVLGQVFTETVDAGRTVATATTLPSGTVQVNGSLADTADADADLYIFQPTTSGSFTLSLAGKGVDGSLLIFNASGQGLGSNDDSKDNDPICNTSFVPPLGSLDSCLTLNLTAGLQYFIAVGDADLAAFESIAAFNRTSPFASATTFLESHLGVLDSPTAKTLGLVGNFSGVGFDGEFGPYKLYLSSTLYTPPSTAIPSLPLFSLLILAALLMLLGRSRMFKL